MQSSQVVFSSPQTHSASVITSVLELLLPTFTVFFVWITSATEVKNK